MNFQQLEYVMAVHKHKHFGLAAESCHITQATLSAMIKKLEQELDIVIFDRSRKPVMTTDQGLQLLEHAKIILREQKNIRHLSKEPEDLSGTLSIGVIPTIANALLPLILKPIMDDNPNLILEVSEITTDEIIHQLSMDKIDLGILATPINNDQFEEHIMYYEPMLVYGVEDSKRKFVSSKDVKDKTIWLLEEGHCFRNQTMTICEIQEKEMEKSNLHFKGSSFETLLNLTDKFGGYTLLPELYYTTLSDKLQSKTKAFQTPIPVREVSIISYRQHANKLAIDYLTKKITELVSPLLSTSKYKKGDLDIIGI